jgi:hypothetical protein
MDSMNRRHPPIEVLGHFIPAEVLGRAHELALQFKRDEVVRAYAEQHWWLIVTGGGFAMVLSSAFTAGAFMLVFGLIQPPPFWIAWFVWVGLPVTWIGATIGQLYLLFDWLEKKALAKMAANPSRDKTALPT